MTGCMSSPLDPRELIPAAELQGISSYETRLLKSYQERARACLESFAWCTSIRQELFAAGVGNQLAVFLMEVLVKGRKREWLWVVAGELPAAYFAQARAPCPCQALRVYRELVERWVDAVLHGTLDRDVFALGVEATPKAAAALRARLAAIERIVLPMLCQPAEPPEPPESPEPPEPPEPGGSPESPEPPEPGGALEMDGPPAAAPDPGESSTELPPVPGVVSGS